MQHLYGHIKYDRWFQSSFILFTRFQCWARPCPLWGEMKIYFFNTFLRWISDQILRSLRMSGAVFHPFYRNSHGQSSCWVQSTSSRKWEVWLYAPATPERDGAFIHNLPVREERHFRMKMESLRMFVVRVKINWISTEDSHRVCHRRSLRWCIHAFPKPLHRINKPNTCFISHQAYN